MALFKVLKGTVSLAGGKVVAVGETFEGPPSMASVETVALVGDVKSVEVAAEGIVAKEVFAVDHDFKRRKK